MNTSWTKVPFRIVEDSLVSDKELRLYVHILRFALKTGMAWPTLETLSRKLGCSVRTVSRLLHHLEFLGYIRITKSVENGKQRNSYIPLIT